MLLQERRAVITGAAAGIGRAIALRFAKAGAELVLLDIDAEQNERTAKLVVANGSRCTAIPCNVGSEQEVVAAFERAGPVDVLVNNAGSAVGDARIPELSGDRWDMVQAVCLKSVFLCTREALVWMRRQGRGAIVNISSVNALAGINLAAYSAAKGGVLAFTRLTAAQHALEGIRANAICPGTILSESSSRYYEQNPRLEQELRSMYPDRSFGTVEDVAECALFLASDASRFINGVELPVDGGLLATRALWSLEEREH